jgi:hypothetical protein
VSEEPSGRPGSRAPRKRATGSGTRAKKAAGRKAGATDRKAENVADTSEDALLKARSSLPATTGDGSTLLENCRTKWQHGAWHELITIPDESIAQDSERAKLALILSAAHAHTGDQARSHQLAKQAMDWGADRRTAARILISAAYNTLGRVAQTLDESDTALAHFSDAVTLVEHRADAKLLAKTRQIRETGNLGLLPDAIAAFGSELQQLRKDPDAAATRLDSLERELALLRHDLSRQTSLPATPRSVGENPAEADQLIWPELTFPPEEAELIQKHYAAAGVILEYGSGGSTVLGAKQPGKLILSVESDARWAQDLQSRIDAAGLPSPVIMYHADIGPTGAWGRPVDESHWRQFHRYPTAIWSQDFFRQPDLVLIDGRFRPACFVTTCLRTTAPVTVLFDDYADRPAYHVVERLMEPVRVVGRVAEFFVEPRQWPGWVHDLQSELFTAATFSTQRRVDYARPQQTQ